MVTNFTNIFEFKNDATGIIDGTTILNNTRSSSVSIFSWGLVASLMESTKYIDSSLRIDSNDSESMSVYHKDLILSLDNFTNSITVNKDEAIKLFPFLLVGELLINADQTTLDSLGSASSILSLGYEKYYLAYPSFEESLKYVTIDPTLSRWGNLSEFNLGVSNSWSVEATEIITFNEDKYSFVHESELIVDLVKWYQVEDCSLLSGPTSSGKTTVFGKIASILGLPFYVQNFDKDTDPDKILGTFLPTEDGKFVYSESPFVKAFKYGGFYLADEINFVHGDITAVFHSALDGQAQIILPTGEVIRKHPLFRMGAGINEQYSGTKPLNIAFLRRMKRKDRLDSMTVEQLLSLTKDKFSSEISQGKITEDKIKNMVNVVKKIEEKYENEQVSDASIGVTHLFSWVQMFLITGDWLRSARSSVVNLSCEDMDVNEEVFRNIVTPNQR